jgi:MFS family permease
VRSLHFRPQTPDSDVAGVVSDPVERKWWTLLASCIAIFMLLLDVTIVNVALPSIERDLGADFSDLQWVIDAYALTLAGFVLAAGSLADMVGRRLVFMLGLAIFSASSLACGLAPDPLFLNVSRAAQGIGAAMMFGTSLALIAQEFQGRERGTALGIWGATTAAAVSTGPLVGGALVDALSWRWIFLVNVPIGLAALVVAQLRLRESRDPGAAGVDLRGVALLCPALFLLVYALIRGNEEGWGSALIISCFAASALLLVLFVVAERRAAHPLLDLSLFRKPAFTGAHDRRLRAGGVDLLDVPLHHALLPERVGLLAVRGGPPIAAGHRADPVRFAAERPRALQAVPPADRDKLVGAAHHAFVTGFNTIALVSVAVAAVGSLAGYALVRSRDFVVAPGAAPAPPEAAGAKAAARA